MTANDESNLWLPPRRMRQYEIAKAATGLIAIFILAWLTAQWSGVMQWMGIALIIITAWVTIGSIITDIRHARGRQVGVEGGTLRITDGQDVNEVPLCDISRAQWRDDDAAETGLFLYGEGNEELGRLNTHFLADETEARTFIGWLRGRAGITLHVDWPDRG